MATEIECPGCGETVEGPELLGQEFWGVYDGILIWTHMTCGHSWPRFSNDEETGNPYLHQRAVEIIAGWKSEESEDG